MHKVFVTGGTGFIGSHRVDRRVTVLDGLIYVGDRRNPAALDSPKLWFVEGDIRDPSLVAESHVDRFPRDVGNSVSTNVMGTQALLNAAMGSGVQKFVHVSTDEVYSPMTTGEVREDAPLRPMVLYAANKAVSDLMAMSCSAGFGFPVCVTRSSDNHGPRQHPGKLMPPFLHRLLTGEPVTVHGHGQHLRNWLHVKDHCRAIEPVPRRAVPGEIHDIGGGTDLATRELTGRLLRIAEAGRDSVTTVADRTANDIRYAMEWSKIAGLDFQLRRDRSSGLAETARWYRGNVDRRTGTHAELTAVGA